jgi:hypothetical protein
MKSLYKVLIAFLFIATSVKSFAITNPAIDTLLKDKTKKHYLEMRGYVVLTKESETDKATAQVLDSAVINIYTGGASKKLLVTYMTNKKGKCDFRLPLDQSFVIEVTKAGYITKFIEVNTKVPADQKAAFIFPFQVDIFEEVKGLDVSALKKAIAKINYSTGIDQFMYDTQYTNRINNDLKKIYKEYYFMQTMDADTTKKQEPVNQNKKKMAGTNK